MAIRIGPSELGGVDEAVKNLERFHELGFKACEIEFTYGVYIKKDKDNKEIEEIRKAAEKYDIKLSIHAPYWINLNSDDKKKVEQSKKRILDSCEVGELLGVKYVVFHPGYYGKQKGEETYDNIKKEISDMQNVLKKSKWKIRLAPETTGKVNVFGKEEEILALVKDTGCFFTLDFSHLYARTQGKMTYKEMLNKVKEFKTLHCHFSGIEFGEKGEKNHKMADEKEIRKLMTELKKIKGKEISVISESPDPVFDSKRYLEIFKGI